MRPLSYWFFSAGLSLLACAFGSPAHAEGRCPPGYYPTGGGSAGWEACAPMGPIEEAAGDREEENGSYVDGLPFRRFDPEEWKILMEGSRKAEEWREAERMKDPAYRRLKQGYWEYPEANRNDRKQICLASFLTPQGGVMLMDWAGENPGTFLAFYGAGIAPTKQIVRQRLSLKQSGETQQVQAFRGSFPWEQRMGMVMFAVPSTQALLDAIKDVQDFEVASGDETFIWGEWHSGHQARDQLRQCISRRR